MIDYRCNYHIKWLPDVGEMGLQSKWKKTNLEETEKEGEEKNNISLLKCKKCILTDIHFLIFFAK